VTTPAEEPLPEQDGGVPEIAPEPVADLVQAEEQTWQRGTVA
jgi:hypothetical protein